jgi:hypothetical protein
VLDAAFQRRHPLFEDILGRIHDAGVDIAGHFQGKYLLREIFCWRVYT